jgi:hypothetical protein
MGNLLVGNTAFRWEGKIPGGKGKFRIESAASSLEEQIPVRRGRFFVVRKSAYRRGD